MLSSALDRHIWAPWRGAEPPRVQWRLHEEAGLQSIHVMGLTPSGSAATLRIAAGWLGDQRSANVGQRQCDFGSLILDWAEVGLA